ncbi:MAG: hypothetical protein AB1352_02260 [Patescibacteria group bacterium]
MMRLSLLQKYILRTVYESHLKRFPREKGAEFYRQRKSAISKDEQVKIITKSIERLIDRELMVGYGVRTPHKWYIHEVKLTSKGRKVARSLRGEQQILPFGKARKNAESNAESR